MEGTSHRMQTQFHCTFMPFPHITINQIKIASYDSTSVFNFWDDSKILKAASQEILVQWWKWSCKEWLWSGSLGAAGTFLPPDLGRRCQGGCAALRAEQQHLPGLFNVGQCEVHGFRGPTAEPCHFQVQFGFLLSLYDRIPVHSVTIVKIHDFNRCLPAFPFTSVQLQSQVLRRIKQ